VGITDFLAEQWILVSILAALVSVFMWTEMHKGGKALSFHQVTRMLNSGEAVLLDVREKKDFDAGHIVDSIHIAYTKLKDRVSELEKHKTRTIIVVDKLGQHAGAAGKILKDHGFDTARLQGGIAEWTGQNLPLVK